MKPKFQKRHYEATAREIREAAGYMDPRQRDMFIDRMVKMFREDNPTFQPIRFRKACDPDPVYEVTPQGVAALMGTQRKAS